MRAEAAANPQILDGSFLSASLEFILFSMSCFGIITDSQEIVIKMYREAPCTLQEVGKPRRG